MLRCFFMAVFLLCVMPAFANSDTIQIAQNAPPPPPPAKVDMMVTAQGDHWAYEVKDDISGAMKEQRKHLVTDVTTKDIAVHIEYGNTGRSSNTLYDKSWNVLSGNGNKFTPNDGSGVLLPLALNAQWKFSANVINSTNGGTWKRNGDSHVARQETVTTKAGQFDAYVIETHVTVRNTKDPTRVTEYKVRTWFSPEVNHWVKRTVTTIQDGHVFNDETVMLIEYGRKL
jgi:hypothetical protein